MIDFDSLQPRLETSAGEVKGLSIQQLPDGNIARIGFHFVAGELPAAEFRLWLDSEGQRRLGSLALPLERLMPNPADRLRTQLSHACDSDQLIEKQR